MLDAAVRTLAGGATPAPGAPRPAARAEDRLPPFWSELAALGWLGLHVAEEHGGQGYGLAELASWSRSWAAVVAPGPFLPTVMAAAVIAEAGPTHCGPSCCRPGRRLAVGAVGLEPPPRPTASSSRAAGSLADLPAARRCAAT